MFSRLMTGVFKGRSYDPFVWSIFIITPLIVRVYAYAFAGIRPVLPALVRGFASDASIGLLVGAAVCLLPLKRPLRYALWAIWTVVFSLNTVHILVNHSHMNANSAPLPFRRTSSGAQCLL